LLVMKQPLGRDGPHSSKARARYFSFSSSCA